MSKLSILELVKLPFFELFKSSQKENIIRFISNLTDQFELYELNTQTREWKQISENLFEGSLPWVRWCKNEESFIFGKDVEGNEVFNLYKYEKETGNVQRLTESGNKQGPMQLINNDKELIFFDEYQLSKMNLETLEITNLTKHERPVYGACFCDKDGNIYYSSNQQANSKNANIWRLKSDLSIEPEIFLQISKESREMLRDMSEDGELVVFDTDRAEFTQAGIFNAKTDEIHWFGENKCDEKAIELSRDKQKLLVIRKKEVESLPIVYDTQTGKELNLQIGGVIQDARFCHNDEFLIYSRSDPVVPSIFAMYNLKTHEEYTLINAAKNYSEEDFMQAEHVKYQSFDNLEIGAVLHKPAIKTDKKYPAIIQVMGGPGSQSKLTFNVQGQLFATNGFILITPNYRGSSGYGRTFYDMNIGDIGGGDAQDIIYTKKFLETLPYIDKNRIGVMGRSYGGFMTYLLMSKFADEGWSAGIAEIGITHWKNAYDQGDFGYKCSFEELFNCKYEENPELWEDRSPLNFVERVKAPIFMMQGVNDRRCPVEEARRFRDKMIELDKEEGRDFEYIEFGDQGHGGSKDDQRIRNLELTLDFFRRRL